MLPHGTGIVTSAALYVVGIEGTSTDQPPPKIPLWVSVMILVAGVAGLYAGIQFFVGRNRGPARYYFRSDMPFFFRNLAFGLIPGGVTFVLWGVAGLLSHGRHSAAVLATLLASALSLAVAMFWMANPPTWSKPMWLRQLEVDSQRSLVETE